MLFIWCCHVWTLILVTSRLIRGTLIDYQGPAFVHEPPNKVLFYNNSGSVIPCVASGVPRAEITWTLVDNTTVTPIPGLRHLRPDGSLVFPPFSSGDYRQDIHANDYRCVASNVVGNIASRDVHVRGVIQLLMRIGRGWT